MQKLQFKKSFTLVELMIVIAILAILSAIVIFALNPARLFDNFRDSKRITDITAINKGIIFLESWNANGITYGTSTNVYLSLPDSSSTCSNYSGLPTLTSGYSYYCVTSTSYKNVDGTGWIPINFTVADNNKYLSSLPVDPTNDSTYFYSYFPGGSYELVAKLTTTRKEASEDSGVMSNYMELRSVTFHQPTPVVKGNNCLAIKTADANAKSGTYWINPSNDANAYPVYCDMVNQGGGWTLIFSSQTVPGMADKAGSHDNFLRDLLPTGSMLSTWTPFTTVSTIRFACDGNKNGTLDYDGIATTNGNTLYSQIKNCANGLCETRIALDDARDKGSNNDTSSSSPDNWISTGSKWGTYDDYPYVGNDVKDMCNGIKYRTRTIYPIAGSTSNAYFYIFVK